jgi:hypothetical protein
LTFGHKIESIICFPGFLPALSSNYGHLGAEHYIAIACSVMLKTSNVASTNGQGRATSGTFINSSAIYIYIDIHADGELCLAEIDGSLFSQSAPSYHSWELLNQQNRFGSTNK